MTYICAYSVVKSLIATFAGHLVAGIDQTSVYGVFVAACQPWFTIFHIGGCDVDGSRGCAHVSDIVAVLLSAHVSET